MGGLTELDWRLVLALADNNMNETEVARSVYMHRNTVCYHLRKVKALTGLDPMRFYDLIKLVQIAKHIVGCDEGGGE